MATDVSIRVGVDGEKEFRSALNSINNQIKSLNNEMKSVVSGFTGMDSAETRTAKQTDVLGRAIDATKRKIKTIGEEYDRQKAKLEELGAALDEASSAEYKSTADREKAITKATNAYNRQAASVNKLSSDLNAANADLNRMENEMRDLENSADRAGGALDDLGDDAQQTGNSLKDAFAGGAIAGGIQSLIDGVSNLIDQTSEYRRIMASLETSSEKAGYTAEQTASSYRTLYGVLADEQTAATTTANLQAIGLAQGDLETMINSAIGAWATYGDSIPIDSLAESINETIRAGQVTGTFADVLNWGAQEGETFGVTMRENTEANEDWNKSVEECENAEDYFNLALQDAETQAERTNLVMQAMAKQGLAEAGQAWQENNQDILAANDANASMTETLAEMAETVSPLASSIKNGLAEAIGALNTPLQFVVDHSTAFASALAGVAAVVGTVKIANIVTDLSGVATAAASGADALMAYSTSTKAAAGAQALLNAAMSVTPLGALALALGGVLAGMAAYVNMSDDYKTESELMAEALNELTEKSNEYQEAQAQIAERRDEQLASSESELAHAQEMIAELDLLTDANGRVAEGEEARAQTLANLINEIIPGAVEWTNQQSGAYANLASNLDMLIEKERLNALIMANQEAYQAAVQNQQAYMDGMIEAAQNVDYYTQRVEELKAAIASGVYEGDPWGDLGEAQQALDQYSQELENFKNLYSDSSNTIMQQEALMAAAASNDYATMQEALASYGSSLTQFTGSNQAELQQQAADMQAAYDTMLALSQEYPGLITDAQLAEAQSRAQRAKQIAEQAGQEEAQAQASGLKSGQSDINAAGEANAKSGAEGASSQTSAFNTAGVNAGVGYASGIRSQGGAARSAGAYLANQATAGLNSAQQSHSPSRVTMKSGEWFTQGYENGIAKGKNALLRGASVMVAGAIGILDKGGNTAEDVAIRTSRKLGDALLDEQDKLNKQLAELEQRDRDRQAEEELADYEEKIKKKYEELEKAETSERKKIQDEIARMEEEWRDEQLKEQLDAQLDVLEEFTKQYEDALEEIQNKQDDMADKLRDYGDLFETVKTETGEFIELGDIEEDIAAIERYGEALDQLKERGISGSLMDEILDMDIDDALAYTDELLTMTDDQYDSYMALWEQKQEEAQKIAKKFYQDEMDALQDEFVDKIPDELGHVKDEMRTIGVDGIQSMIDGMYSRSGALWSAASSIVSQAIAAMRAEADIHSPSKKVAEMVGMPMGEGVAVGMLQGIKESRRAIDEAIMSPINQVSADDIYNAAAGAVNGITAAGSASGTQTIIIPVNLNGKQIAEVIYDPLRQVGKQRGVAFG